MKRWIVFLSIITLSFFAANAQTLYTPRNIQDAYRKGTRSPDGNPGKHYWQNTARYDIQIKAMPPDRLIRGKEHIVYVNHSPDTLRTLAFRLILNIHQPEAGRAFPTDPEYLTSGVGIDSFRVRGTLQPWKSRQPGATAIQQRLEAPLLPGDSIALDFEWHYTISLKSGREGMIDSTTYYLAYFYPRVAVYDDYNGWDMLPFTDMQEFYNDFNNYTLSVEVPRNYLVWATGDLQNASQVLQPRYAERLAASFRSDSVLHIAQAEDLKSGKVTTDRSSNTWVWTASHVSDMAVGLSDHYCWDASSVLVDDQSGRRTSVQAAFLDAAQDFHHSVTFGQHALSWYSHHWPGIPYPYSKMTAFQGFADMEYPMMVNDESMGDNLVMAQLVQDHEIAHSYFPFYMGINESRYAFMDEGWATTLELLIGRTEQDSAKVDEMYREFRVNGWIHDPSQEEDLPIISPANALTGMAYGNNAYGKAALGYLALKDMLGDDLFKRSLHEYMRRWNGRHPIPWDFFYSINEASGKNLNWFWQNWYFSNNYIDLAIRQVQGTSGSYRIEVENVGGHVAPFDLIAEFQDGSKEVKHQKPAIWEKNQKTTVIILKTSKKLRQLTLNGGIFVDAHPSDNIWKP